MLRRDHHAELPFRPMRRGWVAGLGVFVALGVLASPATAYPKPRPAHSNHEACLRLVQSYGPGDMDTATMRAGDALNWFLYESRTKSVRAIMGTRVEDDAHAPRDWGPQMGAWCKATYPKDAAIQAAKFPA